MKATKRFRAVSFRHLQAASLLVNSVAAPARGKLDFPVY